MEQPSDKKIESTGQGTPKPLPENKDVDFEKAHKVVDFLRELYSHKPVTIITEEGEEKILKGPQLASFASEMLESEEGYINSDLARIPAIVDKIESLKDQKSKKDIDEDIAQFSKEYKGYKSIDVGFSPIRELTKEERKDLVDSIRDAYAQHVAPRIKDATINPMNEGIQGTPPIESGEEKKLSSTRRIIGPVWTEKGGGRDKLFALNKKTPENVGITIPEIPDDTDTPSQAPGSTDTSPSETPGNGDAPSQAPGDTDTSSSQAPEGHTLPTEGDIDSAEGGNKDFERLRQGMEVLMEEQAATQEKITVLQEKMTTFQEINKRKKELQQNLQNAQKAQEAQEGETSPDTGSTPAGITTPNGERAPETNEKGIKTLAAALEVMERLGMGEGFVEVLKTYLGKEKQTDPERAQGRTEVVLEGERIQAAKTQAENVYAEKMQALRTLDQKDEDIRLFEDSRRFLSGGRVTFLHSVVEYVLRGGTEHKYSDQWHARERVAKDEGWRWWKSGASFIDKKRKELKEKRNQLMSELEGFSTIADQERGVSNAEGAINKAVTMNVATKEGLEEGHKSVQDAIQNLFSSAFSPTKTLEQLVENKKRIDRFTRLHDKERRFEEELGPDQQEQLNELFDAEIGDAVERVFSSEEKNPSQLTRDLDASLKPLTESIRNDLEANRERYLTLIRKVIAEKSAKLKEEFNEARIAGDHKKQVEIHTRQITISKAVSKFMRNIS